MNIFLTLAKTGGSGIGFCTATANIWQLIGYVVLVFKIVIPILLIIFGIIDLGKAVVAGKQDEVKKNVMNLVWRVIAGIIIFLIPTIISFIIGFVGNFNNDSAVREDYNVCRRCVSNPTDSDCKSKAEAAWKN